MACPGFVNKMVHVARNTGNSEKDNLKYILTHEVPTIQQALIH